jgi:hypothetical protein
MSYPAAQVVRDFQAGGGRSVSRAETLSCIDDLILHILRNSSDSGVTPLKSKSSRHTRSEVLWWFIEQAENMVTQ